MLSSSSSSAELISVPFSIPLLAFCICHLIVAFLLLRSSSSNSDDIGSTSSCSCSSRPVAFFGDVNFQCPMATTKKEEEQEEGNGQGKGEENDAVAAAELGDGNREDYNDDELKKRAEEFIQKMNRAWKAEREVMLNFSQ